MRIHHQAIFHSILKTSAILIAITMPLYGCNLNLFQSDCAALDISMTAQENALLTEHQKQLDELKNMYFNFGFKKQLSMAIIDTLADPSDDLVQLSTQYQNAVKAIDKLGPDECDKKLEFGEKRISLFRAKLELQRKVLDERTTAIIDETSDI